jgi:hypothetical protein
MENYGRVWERVIAPINLEDLRRLGETAIDEIKLPADLWARILFDYIVAYRDQKNNKKKGLLNSLIPIYFVRTLSFINETRRMGTKATEEFLDRECRTMEAEKYYLITKWNQTPRKDGLPSIAQYLVD